MSKVKNLNQGEEVNKVANTPAEAKTQPWYIVNGQWLAQFVLKTVASGAEHKQATNIIEAFAQFAAQGSAKIVELTQENEALKKELESIQSLLQKEENPKEKVATSEEEVEVV